MLQIFYFMKKLFVVICASLFVFIYPPAHATESWLNITQPSPGIYFQGEKIFSLKSMVVLLGYSSIHIEAEGSDNIFSVYFAMYDIFNKDIVESYWDINKGDGWNCEFSVSRGVYAIMAAGAAIDIDEPIAIDWLAVIVV